MKIIMEGQDSFNPNPNLSVKPKIFTQIRIPKLGICPSTRKEVAGCSVREIDWTSSGVNFRKRKIVVLLLNALLFSDLQYCPA
jgi:hypothetical protein